MPLGKIFFILFLGFLLNACTTKEYKKQESIFLVFKTPAFKYADLGFIYENSETLKVELYGSGQALMSLEISQSNVCMSLLECMSKKSFNQKVLNAAYPEDILKDVLKGKMIFQGLNAVKTRNGFTQNIIKSHKYNINYSVLNKQILFRDKINHILIKVTRMGG